MRMSVKKKGNNLEVLEGTRADLKTKSKNQQSATSTVISDLFKRIEGNRKFAL